MRYVLAATMDPAALAVLPRCFTPDIDLELSRSTAGMKSRLAARAHDIALVDMDILCGGTTTDYETIRQAVHGFRQQHPSVDLIVLARADAIRQAVDAVRAGAGNYLTYPLHPEEVRLVTQKLHESALVRSELDYLRDRLIQGRSGGDEGIVLDTRSPRMREVYDKIRLVAATRSTVLLTGETGTGKSLIARLIHSHSNRHGKRFISVHCGAIPEALVESELFGHEKGAFTGAIRKKPGRFEIAEGGTIFLDEIGTIGPSVQIKLLNVLQDRCFQRVGGETVIRPDVRVVAATNEDLSTLCAQGRFRRDLYYRLNVFPIDIPPLRERKEDILQLAEAFVRRCNPQRSRDIRAIHPDVIDAFMRYDWPGNVRELENIIERACILEGGEVLSPEAFPAEFRGLPHAVRNRALDMSLPLEAARRHALDSFEREYLERALATSGGSIKGAAAIAGVTTRQIHKLMTRHSLQKEDFKPGSGRLKK
jgi:DNA-binding NtrC family response regulator